METKSKIDKIKDVFSSGKIITYNSKMTYFKDTIVDFEKEYEVTVTQKPSKSNKGCIDCSLSYEDYNKLNRYGIWIL